MGAENSCCSRERKFYIDFKSADTLKDLRRRVENQYKRVRNITDLLTTKEGYGHSFSIALESNLKYSSLPDKRQELAYYLSLSVVILKFINIFEEENLPLRAQSSQSEEMRLENDGTSTLDESDSCENPININKYIIMLEKIFETEEDFDVDKLNSYSIEIDNHFS